MAALCVAAMATTTACAKPFLAKDGQLVFQESGAHGAAVITANGVEFHDREDIPQRVIARDVNDPWKAPIGFILPASGRFTQTSAPLTIASQGIVIVLRPSDTRVPSWGGEMLVRADVHVVAAPSGRDAEHVAVVVDGDEAESVELVEAALGQLGAMDKVAVIDARGPRVVVPTMPATHRSLALAATIERIKPELPQPSDLEKALVLARATVGNVGARRVLVLSGKAAKAPSFAVSTAMFDMQSEGIAARAFDPTDVSAKISVRTFVPPAGAVVFRDFTLEFAGDPQPSHVLESSSGPATWVLDGGFISLGDLHAGEARAEVLRISVPAWVPGSTYHLRVSASAIDASTNVLRTFESELTAVYDEDIERIAESRNGDVIAYASALATLHRLGAAFFGEVVEHEGLDKLARMQARSLVALAKDFPDRGFAEDAAVLNALLLAVPSP